jgi:hypothetical protein
MGDAIVLEQPLTRDTQRQDHPRIETQIHRRKKAKAFSVLESEWDQVEQMPPLHLRMPTGRMASSTLPNMLRTPHRNKPLQAGKSRP